MWDTAAFVRLGFDQYLSRAFRFQVAGLLFPTQSRFGWGESSLKVSTLYGIYSEPSYRSISYGVGEQVHSLSVAKTAALSPYNVPKYERAST